MTIEPEPQFTADMARAAMARLREEAAYNHPVRLEKERLRREELKRLRRLYLGLPEAD